MAALSLGVLIPAGIVISKASSHTRAWKYGFWLHVPCQVQPYTRILSYMVMSHDIGQDAFTEALVHTTWPGKCNIAKMRVHSPGPTPAHSHWLLIAVKASQQHPRSVPLPSSCLS